MMSLKPTSFHIIEKDTKENLIIWNYPTIHDNLRITIAHTLFSRGLDAIGQFYYQRTGKQWIYVKQFIGKNDKPAAIVITSQCFQPNLYAAICESFSDKYRTGANGADLVKIYLSIYTKNGICMQDDVPESFLSLKSYPWRTDLKGIIKNLGIEVIFLYNALLLKKQILVYHPDVEELQQALVSISRLTLFKNPENMLQPLVKTVEELKKKSTYNYLTGTINHSLLNRGDLYDLVVDLKSQTIKTSAKAKDDFHMSPLHKDIAHTMINLSESNQDEKYVIDEISKKTSNIFQHLKSKTADGGIRINDIESIGSNKNLRTFLINLATAENMLII